MKKGLLPIGTVVLLEGGTKKVMICGYSSKSKGDSKVFDYNGCVFPEGFMENIYCLFNHDQIETVYYDGLKNNEFVEYMKNGLKANASMVVNENDENKIDIPKEKYLPIGSVVLLKGGTHKIMINGYCAIAEERKDKIFDYRGCPYPEGILESSGVALFDISQIDEICHVGFRNDESLDFLDKLEHITSK